MEISDPIVRTKTTHHMVTVLHVELDGILRGSGYLLGDYLTLGDGRGPLHLQKQPPPHPLTSVFNVCRYSKYIEDFLLRKNLFENRYL